MVSSVLAATEATSLRGLILERSALGDQPFITIDDRTLSYGEAHEASNRCANGLVALGVGAGDVVASLMYNSIEHLLLWFACAKIGAIWAPLNVSLVGRDLSYALNDTRARLFVVDAELFQEVERIRSSAAVVEALVVNGTDDLPSGCLPWGAIEGAAGTPAYEPLAADAAGITYTGGSTGMPKGVLVPQYYFIATGKRYPVIAESRPDDIHFSIHHLFHSGGQGLAVMGPMVAGIHSIMSRWFSASRYWDRARAHGATVIDPIGSVMMALLRQPESARDRDHSVRVAVGSATGQMAPAERIRFQERFNVPLLEVYAQSESGTLFISETLADRRVGSSGRVGRWADVQIVDPNGFPVPAGEIGEICMRPTSANSFMLGYFGKDDVTSTTWRDLWHHTSDLGYLDEDGFLFFKGRQAHWMRRRGENVSAYEVEAVVRDFAGVVEAVAVGVPSEIGDEDIRVFLQVEDGGSVDPSALIAHCEKELAYFKIPRYIEMVDDFPRTTSKREIDRQALKDRPLDPAAWDRGLHGPTERRTPQRSESAR